MNNNCNTFLFFGCWNNINCDNVYIYRDIVLDYIIKNEKKCDTLYLAGDNWYNIKLKKKDEKFSTKYYLQHVLKSGYDKIYKMNKNVHIAVGNHDEDDDGEKKEEKKDCMIKTQLQYIKNLNIKRKDEEANALEEPTAQAALSAPNPLREKVAFPNNGPYSAPSALAAIATLASLESKTSSSIASLESKTSPDVSLSSTKKHKARIKNDENCDETIEEMMNPYFITLEDLLQVEKADIKEGKNKKNMYIYIENVGEVECDIYIMIIINTNKLNNADYMEKIISKFKEFYIKKGNRPVFVMGHVPIFCFKNDDLKEVDENMLKIFDLLAQYKYIYLCADSHYFNIMKIEKNEKCVLQITVGTGGADPDINSESIEKLKEYNEYDGYSLSYYHIKSYGYALFRLNKQNKLYIHYKNIIKDDIYSNTYKYVINIKDFNSINNIYQKTSNINNLVIKKYKGCKIQKCKEIFSTIRDDIENKGAVVKSKDGKTFCYSKIKKDKEDKGDKSKKEGKDKSKKEDKEDKGDKSKKGDKEDKGDKSKKEDKGDKSKKGGKGGNIRVIRK